MSSPYIFEESDFEENASKSSSPEGFHPSAFVSKYRRVGFSLEELREQLQAYGANLKQQLFVIINRDYKDFITIATSLDGVDTRIDYLRKPLNDLRVDLCSLHDGMVSSLQSIQDKLSTHQEVAQKKKLVETFLDIANKIQSAQCILSTDYDAPPALQRSTNDNKVHSKRELLIRTMGKGDSTSTRQIANKTSFICSEIERAAFEVSSAEISLTTVLNLLNGQQNSSSGNLSRDAISRGGMKRSEKQLHQSLESQAASLTKLLVQKVAAKLASILATEEMAAQRRRSAVEAGEQSGSTASVPPSQSAEKRQVLKAVGHCLRACNTIKRGDIAEKILSEAVVEPCIRANMTAAKVDGKYGRGSYSGLETVLQSIISGVKLFLLPFLDVGEAVLACSPVDDDSSVDFILKSIWAPVSTVLLTKYQGMFSIGIPSVLSSCYNTIERFLISLQELVSEEWREAVGRRLRNHSSVREFQSKWKLDIYFQLRCNELMSRLEKGCYISVKHGLTSATAASSLGAMYLNKQDDKDTASSATKKAVAGGESAAVQYLNTHLPNSVTISVTECDRIKSQLMSDCDGVEFQCPLFTVVAMEMMICIHKDVLLPPLGSKFVAFVLRMLLRTEAQLAAMCNVPTPSFTKLGIDQLKHATLQSLNKTAASVIGVLNANTPMKSSAAVDSTTTSVEKDLNAVPANPAVVSTLTSIPTIQTADEYVLIIQDLLLLENWITTKYQICLTEELLSIHSKNSDLDVENSLNSIADIKNAMSNCFATNRFNLRATTVTLWLKMTQIIMTECKRGLVSAVKAIAGKFRMTNKPPPDTASAFIEPIFNPLKKLLNSHGKVVNAFQSAFSLTHCQAANEKDFASTAANWQTTIVEDVTSHYLEQAKALMETVKQMDSALMRRSKIRPNAASSSTTGTASNNLSDSEKIYLQVTLDIDAYGREVEQLGVDSSLLKELRELKNDIATQMAAAHQN